MNLQIADTLINFELPWNPAKKNQRIGRIDRIGQKSNKLTVYNLITQNSIEQQISSGLMVKQSLFDGVPNPANDIDFVDFSTKGRSQFINQLEEFLTQVEQKEKTVQPKQEEAAVLQPTLPFDKLESQTDELDLTGDDTETHEELAVEKTEIENQTAAYQTEEMEKVMNNGLMFLSGLMKMATGKDIGMESQKIEINKETGEVTMKFKIPF